MKSSNGLDSDARRGTGYEHGEVRERVEEVLVLDYAEGGGARIILALGAEVSGCVRVGCGCHFYDK